METQQTQNQENALQPIENIVENAEGQMFTTSLIIAQAFEKEHKNVLRDIENLECSAEFHRLNFEPMVYEAEIGSGAKREFPAYRITRDGKGMLKIEHTPWNVRLVNQLNFEPVESGQGGGVCLCRSSGRLAHRFTA